MKSRIIGILGMVFAIMVFTEASVIAFSYVTKIEAPGESQAFYGEVPVPVKVTVESTTSVPMGPYMFDAIYELQYYSSGRWVAQTSSEAPSLLPIDISNTKFVATFSLPKEMFKGRYGLWRIRAKALWETTDGWSGWRQFKVYER